MSLKEIRRAQGLTMQALSDKSGVPLVTIARAETGKIKLENITLRNALRLADALHCDPHDFLNQENW